MNRAEIKNELKKLKRTGFFSIFVSNVCAKVVTFLGAIVLVRLLSKEDYGIYAGVFNAISMLLLLNDFGVGSASLQYMTESNDDSNRQGQILISAIKIGIIASAIGSILLLLSPYFYPFKIDGVSKFTQILFVIPLFNFINQFIPIILRSSLNNKKFAQFNFASTIITYMVLLPMTLLFGLWGALMSRYLYAIISFVYGIILVKPILKNISLKKSLDKKEQTEFLKFSLISQVNNTIGGLMLIIDTFLIGYMLKSSIVLASYKVSTTLPHALTFLPTCVIVYILPYFIKNKNNKAWLITNYKKLVKYGALIYGFLCLSMILGSKWLFLFLYGKQYLDSILAFCILMVGFFFSATIKIPAANIVYSQRKVKFNLIINIICVVLNIVSNIIFINIFGYVGAAITTTTINIISSIIYVFYVNSLLSSNN